MEELKDKVAIVYDDAIFMELAVRISRDFKKVYYFSTWANEFPYSKDDLIGEGIPGIERISSFWKYVDEADIIIFPGLYYADLQLHLESIGKRVWGSRKGEELELYRMQANKHFKSLGLPRPDMISITGLSALRKHLKSVDDKYIKRSVYRGDGETFHHETYRLSEPMLNEMEHKLGAQKDIYEFIIEDPISGEEFGYDGICIDGQFPKNTLFGLEIKDLGYCGHVKANSEISPLITGFNDTISETLKKYRYRNFMSTEIRIGKDKVPYMIDFTARQPSPPGELYQEICSNLSEVIWYGAEGILIEPEFEAEYGIQVMIHSDWAEDRWQGIYFPEEIRRWVKLRCGMKVGDTYYIVPRYHDLPEIGAVVAIGKTIDEAIKKVKEYADQIKGYRIDIKIGSIDKMQEVIDGGKKLGIVF